jgi:hypothetical protein
LTAMQRYPLPFCAPVSEGFSERKVYAA